MRSNRSSRCTLLAEVNECIWSDPLCCFNPKIVMLRLLTTTTNRRYSWGRHAAHRGLCPVLQINTNFIVLEIAVRQRRLKLYHRLWSLIASWMEGIVLCLVAKVGAVLSTAERLRTILLRILIYLCQWSVLEKIDTASLADASSKLIIICRSYSCK